MPVFDFNSAPEDKKEAVGKIGEFLQYYRQ